MPKIANTNARVLVKSRMPFTGSNLYGRWVTDNLYVVYSYGEHFPLWIYDDSIAHWLENTSKYSRTTTTHKSRTNPYAGSTIDLSNDDMKSVIRHGSYNYWLAAKSARRLAGGAV
jgi:hypothetical protein